MTEPVAFGPLLRGHRRAAGLTLEELAEASGVSARGISDMERGRSRGPQRRTVVALVEALGLPATERAELLAAAKVGRLRAAGAWTGPGGCELPRAVADFTGRGAELDQLSALVGGPAGAGAATLALVSGPAGLGKTALAVHAAHVLGARFPDGAFFLDLRGMDAEPLPSATALTRLVCALGTSEAAVPPDPQDRAGLYRTLLQGKRALVVLDNAADEAQVRPLLPAGGRSLTVLTSRRQLAGLEGVRRIQLGSLSPVEATGLLGAILGPAAAPEAAVGEVARLCGYLPLALQIAGNRLLSRPGWTAQDLADRLRVTERRLDQLVAGDLRVAAAFALSYDQLSGPARRVFRRLGLVPGADFAGPLAAVLAGTGPADAEDALDELDELALLEPAPGGRYRFHDLVRLFARERLATEDPPADRDAAAARMQDWLLDVAVVAGRWHEPEYGPPADGRVGAVSLASAAEATGWLQAEGENWFAALRSAAAAGRSARVVEVAEAMHWFSDHWTYWGHWDEVFRLSSTAAAALGDPAEEARQLNYLSWAQSVQGDPTTGLATAGRARERAASAGDRTQLAWAHFYVALAHRDLGRAEASGVEARTSAALFESLDDQVGWAQAAAYVVDSELHGGRAAAAIDGARRILAVLEGDGFPAVIADISRPSVTARLGLAYRQLGRLPEAADCFVRVAAGMREHGLHAYTARAEETLAGILLAMADPDAAAAAYERSAAEFDAAGAEEDADRVRALATASAP
jgi:transcriptional regulator with XRE-family HTH domain/tetratricopeptide (TPR) repeat protein